MANAWYVLRSKPNKEEFFWNQLLTHRIETFYPCIKVKAVNPRSRKIRPYFPGYLFVHVDLDCVNTSLLHWMPGSGGLVSFDSIPASVPDALIAIIHKKVDDHNQVASQPMFGLKPGDKVEITAGPFAGQEAIFDNCKTGNDRVRVLITILRGRQLPIDLPVEQITRTKVTN
ncbi:MAG: hypothetical protein NTW32_27580 [Chloroflexi bacterium]|nr:hypothetical protein [Chloroflexota bacterium]